MLKTYTEDEMLAIWMREEGFAPSSALTAIEDATEVRKVFLDEIRAWYAAMLRTAPASMLPVEDVAAATEAHWVTANEATLIPPSNLVRPLRLKMADWNFPVHYFPRTTPENEALEHYVPTASTPFTPSAAMMPDGEIRAYGLNPIGHISTVYYLPRRPGASEAPEIIELTAIVEPATDFILDPQLILMHFAGRDAFGATV